ncbi:MAG: 1-acyl-sn-glycerol-3-phosphate acyltransferase [Alphaproteobacteria bacterium]|nr:1-acyl-sn-glycerol-3-phosphate acyltransferase [Alphaproteobacteria bacterium]
MPSFFLATGRLTLYASLTAILVPIQLVAMALNLPLKKKVPFFYHGMVCRILGIRRIVRGRMSTVRPTLFVSNHSSYMDIEVLGAVINGSFVAKSEVADWPVFGTLAKLQNTVFVERRPRQVGAQREVMAARIAVKENLILFPEGTSNDGNRTLPFKSALFSVAELEHEGQPITVQPVSIAYTHLDGIPLGRDLRPLVAWYGDMDLAPHLWTLVGLGRLTVRIIFHEPVTMADFSSRKAMAEYCYRVVAGGVAAALYGRRQPEIELQAAA